MKKVVLTITLLALNFIPAFAQKIPVEITPVQKITTSNDKFLEGDYVDFKITGTDKIVRGLIVKYVENGFAGQEAQLTINQFRALNSDEKYSGTIFVKGCSHEFAGAFFIDIAQYIRGGEVKIIPDKDIFTIWREE